MVKLIDYLGRQVLSHLDFGLVLGFLSNEVFVVFFPGRSPSAPHLLSPFTLEVCLSPIERVHNQWTCKQVLPHLRVGRLPECLEVLDGVRLQEYVAIHHHYHFALG